LLNLDRVDPKPVPLHPTGVAASSIMDGVASCCSATTKRTEQITGVASEPPRQGTNIRGAWQEPRILLRPRPGFYVMRLTRGTPLVPAVIYQLCPMVIPQPTTVDGPNPDEWCRPLDRSPRYGALIDGKGVPIDRIWTARSLKPISSEEYAFRMGPLRRWARAHPQMPEARPEQPVELADLPPLF
jgi:hypothetical protein